MGWGRFLSLVAVMWATVMATDAAEARFTLRLRDVTGKAHTVRIAAPDERVGVIGHDEVWRGAHEGDTVVSGHYAATLQADDWPEPRAQTTLLFNEALMFWAMKVPQFNLARNMVYVMPGVGEGPDLLAIEQSASSSENAFSLFMVRDGVLAHVLTSTCEIWETGNRPHFSGASTIEWMGYEQGLAFYRTGKAAFDATSGRATLAPHCYLRRAGDGALLPCGYLENGTAMVPLMALADGLGASVQSATEGGATSSGDRGLEVRYDGSTVRLWAGSDRALVSRVWLGPQGMGNTSDGFVRWPRPVRDLAGALYVPARAFAKALGAGVLWEPGMVTVRTQQGSAAGHRFLIVEDHPII